MNLTLIPVTTQFERVAEAVTERVTELLGAPTTVINDHGTVVASSRPALHHTQYPANEQASFLRVPLHVDRDAGEVVVSTPLDHAEISPRLAQVLVELVINQTTVVDRLPNQHELKNTFIHDLLHGLKTDEETILREAKLLGMDFVPPRAVILIDAADFILAPDPDGSEPADVTVRRRAQLVIGSVVNFFHLPNDTICAYIGDGEVAVLKASNSQNLLSWIDRADETDQISASWANLQALRRAGTALVNRLRSDTNAAISVGIGRYHPGVCGLQRSYQDARAALSLGQRFHGQNGVHCLDRLGIAAFIGVSDERTKIDLATYLLSPLDHERELITSLEVFFANDCAPSGTATALSIHRNTLAYRLDKISSLTGLDPRRFDHAVQIRLALLLRSLRHQPT